MENYFESEQKHTCNGCGACEYICPVKEIKMREDKEGFLYPHIDKEKCINCGKCKKICSNINLEFNHIQAYCGYSNSEERINSSSGAIFPLLAKWVFNKGGCVCGVRYDENMEAVYDIATTYEDALKFRGSKYVRANINGIFEKVEDALKCDKYVVFVGTPCQVNAVKQVFGKYDKLILCDIICHSNPSPKIFEKFIKYKEDKVKSKICDYKFRNKEKGWGVYNIKIGLNNSNIVNENENMYLNAFSMGLISRPSCYSCQFTTTERCSDITIADFWGVDKIAPEMNDGKGTSLILVNSKKGKKIFDEIKEEMIYKEIKKEDALKYNHNKPIECHKNREKIFEVIDDEKFIKYLKKYTQDKLYKRIAKKILPQSVKKAIKKILYH